MSALYDKLLDEAADERDRVRGIRRLNKRTTPSPSEIKAIDHDTPLRRIATLIAADPAYAPVRWCAEPYRAALSTLDSLDDYYGADDGRSVAAYLLSNLRSYRGETARQVKAELKRRLKQCK